MMTIIACATMVIICCQYACIICNQLMSEHATEFNVSYLKIVSRLVQISRLKHAFGMTLRRNNYNSGILVIGIILQYEGRCVVNKVH